MAEEIDVGMKCIKYMLFVANFMFVMIGFLLISIGSTIKAIYGDFEVFMASHYFSPAILAISIGVIIFFVALFGCVGAVKESTCLINLFGFFLTLLLVMEISAAVAAYAMRGQIESTIREKMSESIEGYCEDVYDRDIWDFTQQRLRCCGIDGADDWGSILFPTIQAATLGPALDASGFTTGTTAQPIDAATLGPALETNEICTIFRASRNSTTIPIPNTCCRDPYASDNTCPSKGLFRDGCLDSLTYIVSESALLLGCGALAVAFIQLLGIIFAWMLAKAIRRLKTQQLMERDQDRQRAYEQLARGKEENQTPVLYTPTFSEA